MNDDLNRFRSLCFLYACGKLDQSEIIWMQQMLQAHPELMTELEADQQLVAVARDAYALDRASTEPLLTFDDIADQIKIDRPNVSSSLHHWFSTVWHHPLPSGWALTAIASLVIAMGFQTYELQVATQENLHNSTYRGGAIPQKINTPMLEVIFSDEVRVSDLRRVLPDLNVAIVCGPDTQGIVNLAVLSGSPEQVLSHLKASKLVIDAHLMKGRAQCVSR